jgi:lipopolysaccharide transport system permease protein
VAVLTPTRPAAVHAPDEVHVISPRPPGVVARLREVWARPGLVWWFAKKFGERLWANTLLGWWWLPLRPLAATLPRALIFGGILKAPSNGTPYLLFFLVGNGAWEMFYRNWYVGTRSMQMAGRFLKRMYLPRLVPLVASCSSGLLEFALYGVFGVFVVIYYTIHDGAFPLRLGINTLLLPAGLILILLLGWSLCLYTAVFGTHGRDTRFAVRSVLHVWMLLTPVIYPLSAVPAQFKTVAECNPMSMPMEMVRDGLFHNGDITALGLAVTIGTIVVVGFFGLRFFNRSEAMALDYL